MSAGSSDRARLAQAYALHQQGRLPEAVAGYRALLSSEPRNADALHLLGRALAQLGRPQDAVAAFAAAVDIVPGNAAMRFNLATALSEVRQDAQAVAHYQHALALNPDMIAAYRGHGAALLRLGRLEEALATLQQAVQRAPNDALAHGRLGVALERAFRYEEALQCFERAIALDPANAELHHNRGLVQAALDRHSAALTSIERALALQPRHAAAHTSHGEALRVLGRHDQALASFDRALAINPRDAITHNCRGLTLLSLNRPADALLSFEQALALSPESAAMHYGRGKACLQLGRPEQALASLERAAALAPQQFDTQLQRGIALALLDRHQEALASFDAALALNPDSADALNNRGVALEHLGRQDESRASFVAVLARRPDYLEAYTNLGNIDKARGDYQQALGHFDQALSIKADDPMTCWSKALLKLTLGDFRQGWPLHEARFRLRHLQPVQRSFTQPRWSGSEPLAGRTVLVHAEQGLGDTLQFCRYIPLLEARGAQVIFEVQPVLLPLMASLGMRGTLIGAGTALPPFDLQIALLSLPLAFGTDLDSIPGGVPYLAADAGEAAAWRERLSGMNVGLNWQGNAAAEKQPWIRGRSFALAAAAPLARVAGVNLVSLQKGPAAAQREQVDFGAQLLQLTDPLDTGPASISATAALMMSLDLVITSDTAVAHLAGALGVPVWVILHAVPDWRWLTERADSPWYPSMRLFRQRQPGNWAEVFDRVAAELALRRAAAR